MSEENTVVQLPIEESPSKESPKSPHALKKTQKRKGRKQSEAVSTSDSNIVRKKKKKKKKKKGSKKDRLSKMLSVLDAESLEAMLNEVALQDLLETEITESHLDSLQNTIEELSLDLDSDEEDSLLSPVGESSSVTSSGESDLTPPPSSESTPNSVRLVRGRSSATVSEKPNLTRSRTSVTVSIQSTPEGRNRSTSRSGPIPKPHPPPRRVGLSLSNVTRTRKRPELNRDALASKLPTPPSTPDAPTSVVDELEEDKERLIRLKASEALRKKLLQESALSSSTLYRARRCSVMQSNKVPLSAVQVEVETLRNRSNTVEAQGALFNNQKQRLYEVLQKTLSDAWRLDLFRRFLAEKHNDNLLDFYTAVEIFTERVKQVEALDIDSENYIETRNSLRSQGRDICTRFVRDTSFPKQVRYILKESAWPLLTPMAPAPTSAVNAFTFDSGSDLSCSDITDSDTLSGSEITDSSDDEDVEFECFVPELDSEEMMLLGTDDPRLFRRSYSAIKPFLTPTRVEERHTKKIIEGFAFFLAQRKILSILLDDLFSEFLCSHNQVYNMSRSFSNPPEPPKELPEDAPSDKSEEVEEATTDERETGDKPEIEYSTNDAGTKIIDACTLQKCVEVISTTGIISNDFHFSSVVTFSYFSTFPIFIAEMRSLLAQKLETITGESEEEVAAQTKKIMIPVIIRITSVLKQLFEIHTEDFRRSNDDYKLLIEFINSDLKKYMEKGSVTLKEFVIKKMTQVITNDHAELQFNEKPPKPKVSKNLLNCTMETMNVHLIHPLELARQLAVLHHKLYRAIRTEECLHMRWTKGDKLEKAPNVLASIRNFCDVGNWVVSVIVQELDLSKREQLLGKLITAAYESFKFKNFNGAMSIISGLQNHCVFRLKATWDELPDKIWDMWEELKDVFKCDQNFAALRTVNSNCSLPAVPYLGMYLSDLTFIDNEANFVDNEKRMINFVKMQYIGNIIRQIEKYQQGGYNFKPVPILQQYLQNLPYLEEKEMYPWSTKCESRKGTRESEVFTKEKKKKGSFLRRNNSKKSLADFSPLAKK